MPVLNSINLVIADISEQERIVAEYYTSQNKSVFIQVFDKNKKNIFKHSLELTKHPVFAVDFSQIRVKQKKLKC